MILLNDLPQDVIHHILSYSDAIKWRNGKYMDKIPKTDIRYSMLTTIPKPRVDIYSDGHFEWIIKFPKDISESTLIRIYWVPNKRVFISQYYCVLYSNNKDDEIIFFENSY
jgi:hypothetical protein